jgi:hypothetical protein
MDEVRRWWVHGGGADGADGADGAGGLHGNCSTAHEARAAADGFAGSWCGVGLGEARARCSSGCRDG